MSKDKTEWKIVLIDDEPDIREVTQIVLRDWGYTVFTADSGEAGLALCRKTAPQVVITDVKMPGMGGLQVLAHLKDVQPTIEVIVMTAFGDIETAIKAIQLNASDFITKPVNDQALELAIDRAKQRYTSASQIREHTKMLENGWTQANRELEKTYHFQNKIIKHAINGIIASDPDGLIKIFNASAEEMTGFKAAQILGRKKLSSLFDENGFSQIEQALAENGHGGPNRIDLMESMIRDHKGMNIPVQISASILFDNEVPEGTLICLRDLRELRRIEREMADQEKILHQDKMMSLGKLAASVVHEINNPLSGILNYLRLMEKMTRTPLDEHKREKFSRYLEIASKETARCSSIISNLLVFSRKSSIRYDAVNVTDLLERTALITRHKLELSNVSLILESPSPIPDLKADANQIQQCLINLIFNALDATPKGGTITLGADHPSGTRRVNIYIADTGSGIPENDLPYIFDPFFTTKKEGHGVGLGLSTVYGIMERHGGAVRVGETGPSGTRFVLEFNALMHS